jgi:hypothetical protein
MRTLLAIGVASRPQRTQQGSTETKAPLGGFSKQGAKDKDRRLDALEDHAFVIGAT